MRAEDVFKDKAFDCLEPERKKAFMGLYNALQGKSPQQAVPIILSFVKAMPPGHNITPAERDAMLAVVTADMSEAERRNMAMILKMVM